MGGKSFEHRVESAKGVKMRIILLSGKPHSGKTSVLDMLAEKLEKKKEAINITDRYEYGDDASEEFDSVFEYKGKKIAIRPHGDVNRWCIDAIVRYAVCDVLVLAYSDKFSWSLADLVKKHASQCDHKVIWKREACDSDNTRACDEIIALL
jgi:tRNA uridine 5-carbamoylmethylation protein Kti12